MPSLPWLVFPKYLGYFTKFGNSLFWNFEISKFHFGHWFFKFLIIYSLSLLPYNIPVIQSLLDVVEKFTGALLIFLPSLLPFLSGWIISIDLYLRILTLFCYRHLQLNPFSQFFISDILTLNSRIFIWLFLFTFYFCWDFLYICPLKLNFLLRP